MSLVKLFFNINALLKYEISITVGPCCQGSPSICIGNFLDNLIFKFNYKLKNYLYLDIAFPTIQLTPVNPIFRFNPSAVEKQSNPRKGLSVNQIISSRIFRTKGLKTVIA